jgi:hypothetical protein
MKFIRREKIITTVFNKELTEEEDIQTVFKNLNEYKMEFSLIVRKFLPQQYDYINTSFNTVKIKKVYEDDTVDFISFKNGSHIVMKKIPFSDVVEINVTTVKHKILDIDSDVTRFDLLDL